jgi:hypothetical protein
LVLPGLIDKGGKMKNNLNQIILVLPIFFFPFIVEGESNEKKSFIREIKEKIIQEKEKVEDKSEEKDKKTYEHKEKKEEEKEPPEEKSRIEKIKETILKEKKKIEKKKEKDKVEVKEKKKNKDKHNEYDRKHKIKKDNDYVHDNNRRYYKKKHKNNHYRYKNPHYYIYDDIYFDEYPGYVTDVRYEEYTYIDESELISPNPLHVYKNPRRIVFLTSSIETAYLGKDLRDTYGITGKISANLYYLHFNCFYQNIFSNEEKIRLYSINGGLSLSTQDLILTPFIGAFYIEPLDEARFSYGANLQVFLPFNYNLDLYTLNSSYGSLNFHNFSASLNYELYRFNFGLGYTYNSYAGVNFSGPFARVAFWL